LCGGGKYKVLTRVVSDAETERQFNIREPVFTQTIVMQTHRDRSVKAQ